MFTRILFPSIYAFSSLLIIWHNMTTKETRNRVFSQPPDGRVNKGFHRSFPWVSTLVTKGNIAVKKFHRPELSLRVKFSARSRFIYLCN